MNEPLEHPSLVQALLRDSAYSHAVTKIRLVETHLSWVFLTGEYVYKVKKPLCYPFVDFSTLALRKHFCEEELLLNRRFNAELYLDVLPIVKNGENGLRVAAAGESNEIVDWAVQMRQFDPSAQADVLLANDQLNVEEVRQFGAHLAKQHETLPISKEAYDPVEPITANFDSLKGSSAANPFAKKLADIARHARKSVEESRQVLQDRHHQGFVRECHGDLHLSNIVRMETGLRAFDCLEFNKDLRTIDIANDIAFLFMDCLVRERADLAYAFIDGYLDTGGDYSGAELLSLFSSYRSMVRAKVAGLRLEQAPDDSSALEKLTKHIEWAHNQSRRAVGDILIMHGYSGAGKSYWASQLVPHLGAIRIRSDVLRKTRAGVSTHQRLGLGVGEAMYSTTTSESVYAAITDHAAKLVQSGERVIIDATSLRLEQRQPFYELANRLGANCRLVAFTARQEVLLQRIQQRGASDDDPSDANADVLAWQQAHTDPLGALEPVIEFDTENGSLETLLDLLQHSA